MRLTRDMPRWKEIEQRTTNYSEGDPTIEEYAQDAIARGHTDFYYDSLYRGIRWEVEQLLIAAERLGLYQASDYLRGVSQPWLDGPP